jgi:hypothetical protein
VSHLCHHSENLTIAFRLFNTAPGTPLWIREAAGLWRLPYFH